MFVNNSLSQPNTNSTPLSHKVWRISVGRIVAVIFLLAVSGFWSGRALPLDFDVLLTIPILIFLVWICLAAFFAAFFLAAAKSEKHLLRQVAVQLGFDAVLVTALVWATGDVRSPYITLYTVIICLTGIFFPANFTLFAAVASTVIFTSLSVLVVLGILPRLTNIGMEVSALGALQIIGFHDVAFLVVGLLAAQLAVRQRRSTVELEETVQSYANLQRLHERIVQSIRSGLVTTDLDGKIYIFNHAAAEITGFKPHEMEGRTIFDLLGNIRRPIAETLNAMEKGEPPPRYEIEFMTTNKFQIRLGYNISPLFAVSGETSGLIVTFQDLTDIRLMEEIQVLAIGLDKESPEAQLMDIVTRESDRLNAIITNFLTYARPRTGEFETVDLAKILKDAVTLLRHSPDVRKAHEIVEEFPHAPVYAVADSVGLKQVFWNLTRNAVQAMPDGGKLTVKLTNAPNNRAQITFVDTGVGMPSAQVERLFEPFSQSTTGGTGLGLSIVYQIVRDHNGTISVRSLEGKGTTITVDLPAEHPDFTAS